VTDAVDGGLMTVDVTRGAILDEPTGRKFQSAQIPDSDGDPIRGVERHVRRVRGHRSSTG
jgi:hypothetical protein